MTGAVPAYARAMAYDEALAARIRDLLAGEPDITEQRMFGGLAFLVGGRMSVAAVGRGGLMVRCEPARTEELLQEPHAHPFEMRGKELSGWLEVDSGGLDDGALERWVGIGLDHARSLPPK